MKVKTALLAAAVALGALLTGCSTTRTEFRPPTDPQGRACLANCTALKQSCELTQQLLNQQCTSDLQRRQADFQRCEAQFRSGPQSSCTQWRGQTTTVNGRTETKQVCAVTTLKQNPCVRPIDNCSSNTTCERNYNQCFVGCGGQIVEVPL